MTLDKHAIEERLTPADRLRIFQALGVHINGRWSADSEWINGLKRPDALGSDRNPSFCINLQTGAVKDFGSDYSNDLYGFVQDVLNLSFVEALEWIIKETGLKVCDIPSVRFGEPKRAQELSPIPIDDALDWCECLLNGVDEASQALKRYLIEKRGLTEKAIRMRALGIWLHKGKHWLFIPLGNDEERVTHFKAFAFDAQAGEWLRDGSGRKIVRAHGEVVLYMMDQALEFDVPLIVCEGEIDSVLARQYGFNAVSGTGGAGTFKDEWVERVKQHPMAQQGICLLYDGDDAGRHGAHKVASKLAGVGIPVRMGKLPEGEDVSDVLREKKGRETLQKIIGAGQPFVLVPEPSFISSASKNIVADEIKTRFRCASQICSSAPSTPEYLAEPWLVAGALTELIGKIKWAGKTTWILLLVKAVLTGKSFLDKSCKRSPVVYLTEQPEASFRQMLFDLGLNDADDLYVLYWHEVMGLSWEDVVSAATAKCKEVGARLLVVDTVFQFAGVNDENSASDSDKAAGPLKMAAALGLAVLCSRHERKGGGDVIDAGRGSSAFSGQMDLILHLKRPEGNAKPTVRIIEGIGRFPLPDSLVIELKDGRYVCRGNQLDVARQNAREVILEVLESRARTRESAMKTANLFDEMPDSVARTVFNQCLKDLAEEGLVLREQLKTQGRPYLYWIPADE